MLRWTWRVSYYAYGALATDRCPPLTLADVPDYPARWEIEYPERLSRGPVPVKWWLPALPHHVIVAFLLGGTQVPWSWGLISVLTLFAGVGLAFGGRDPPGIFQLVTGLDRWVLRVAAYAGLMTDAYPPFRLDMGGREPGPAG